MSIRQRIVLVSLALLMGFTAFGCARDYKDRYARNVNLDHTTAFLLEKTHYNIATHVEGTVFVYGESDNTQHARLVATFYIDPEDEYGFFIELFEGMNLESIDWGYHSNTDNRWVHVSNFSDDKIIWVANAERLGYENTGGGPGALIVDFNFNENECIGNLGTNISICMYYSEYLDIPNFPEGILVDLKQ